MTANLRAGRKASARSLREVPKGYELIDGKLQEKPSMGAESSWLGLRVYLLLDAYCNAQGRGVAVGADFAFRCFGLPNKVRKPDAAVLDENPRTFIPGRPEYSGRPLLVVEVVSPNEAVEELTARIVDFRGIQTPLIWVVEPAARHVTIYRADGTISQVTEPGELSGEGVLPGLAVPLSAILPRREATP